MTAMDNKALDALEARLDKQGQGAKPDPSLYPVEFEAIDALRELRGELAAEKAAHWRTCKTAASEAEECDALRSANEQLERDAARYRWLKKSVQPAHSAMDIEYWQVRLIPDSMHLLGIDAAIDAALAARGSHG